MVKRQQPMEDVPTAQQLRSICYAIRHDYGLLPNEKQIVISAQGLEWWRAIAKEVNNPSQHPYIKSNE